jgi:hypothetical protein
VEAGVEWPCRHGQRQLFESVVLAVGRVPFDFGHATTTEFEGVLVCGVVKTYRRSGEARVCRGGTRLRYGWGEVGCWTSQGQHPCPRFGQQPRGAVILGSELESRVTGVGSLCARTVSDSLLR